MKEPKIVLIGGGSPGWTPGLVTDIMLQRDIAAGEIVLMDINPDAVKLMGQVCQRIRAEHDGALSVRTTTDLEDALDGADFVIVTITTGGIAAMRADLEIPERYQCLQTVGDTVGPGGLSRALRNIPVFAGFARAMEKRCPRAWMLNVSNPLAALTRTVEKVAPIRAFGICHGIDEVVVDYARMVGVEGAAGFRAAGTNHCSWFLDFRVGDADVLAEIKTRLDDGWRFDGDQQALVAGYSPCLKLYHALGYLPAIQGRHVVEFFPFFLHDAAQVERYGLRRTLISDRERGKRREWERARKMAAGGQDIPRQQSREVVAPTIRAAVTGQRSVHVLNMRNEGQIPNLPTDAIVETLVAVDGTGVQPLSAGPLPPQVLAVVLPHVLRQEMTVQAGLAGDWDRALAVLTSDPLVQDLDSASSLLRDMLEANRELLPRFFPA